MKYVKYILFLSILLVFFFIGFYGIVKWDSYKKNKLTTLYQQEVENTLSEKPRKIYSIQDGYIMKQNGLVVFLEVIEKTKNDFTGTLHIRYIEDNFMTAKLIKQNLKVSGNKKKDNSWGISIVDQNYKTFHTTGTLKKQQLKFDSLPLFDKKSYILKQQDYKLYTDAVKMLSDDLAKQVKIRQKNVFSDIEDNKLPDELKTTLASYPLNVINKDEKGRTTIYIHTSYLQELTKRMEINFNKITSIQNDLQSYIKANSPLLDTQFDIKIKSSLNQISVLTDKGNQLLGFYEQVVSFYENPSENKQNLLNEDDEKTTKLMESLLNTYGRAKLKQYSSKILSQQKTTDALYTQASKKTN
ncbi:hypothetical protein CN918_32390 [Priestia megaterium]|nr:hypothetical protein CN918_32390 [Priestia megaterium]